MRIPSLNSKGTDVKEVQSILKKLNYYESNIDGIFGEKTQEAISKLQQDNNLEINGKLDIKTYSYIRSLLLGYYRYKVKGKNTIENILEKYNTSLDHVISSNPNIDLDNIKNNDEIIIPYDLEIVRTDIDYTYEILERNISSLKTIYPFIEEGVIGNSILGKNIYYLKIGEGPNHVFYNACHHSLEWITSLLLMKFTENICNAYVKNESIRGYDIKDLLSKSSIFIVPMVNPDGVDLVLKGLDPTSKYYGRLIKLNKGNLNFSTTWQSNIRGVDLNHNYNASWKQSKFSEKQNKIYGPGPTRYSGDFPESEPESKALANFTRFNDFKMVLAYHSQGKEIYWNYKNMAPDISKDIGEKFSKVSGYKLSEPEGMASFSGYKDWFISKFKRPGFTIEVGEGTNPLPISQFEEIYNDNEEILLMAPSLTI
ncbi:gamma-D-glutamyl-L-diamino acid endopeptidase I [Gottschalkia purinilytica]|uniref:Gamma-D-glutamyl-L-diamino acid endopeptidase I n=1 Tax=Gottschalkia purinilytica TaxID=1503 RepID=A0A0L0WEJ1_GOTPU|nr:M14 family zinc carboxypeptidase [Gottschalkia purinilytica]KNF09897.1 gamma-D-glutamyl-L-diamino acid endopeptidase I [Gottschalkia purinilytica]